MYCRRVCGHTKFQRLLFCSVESVQFAGKTSSISFCRKNVYVSLEWCPTVIRRAVYAVPKWILIHHCPESLYRSFVWSFCHLCCRLSENGEEAYYRIELLQRDGRDERENETRSKNSFSQHPLHRSVIVHSHLCWVASNRKKYEWVCVVVRSGMTYM